MVGDSKGHQGQALDAPRKHCGIILGMSMALGWHISMYTWALRFVWRVTYGCNDMRCDITYHFQMLTHKHSIFCIGAIREVMNAMSWHNEDSKTRRSLRPNDYAWHKGTMPYAREQLSHGCNVIAQCCDQENLDMA